MESCLGQMIHRRSIPNRRITDTGDSLPTARNTTTPPPACVWIASLCARQPTHKQESENQRFSDSAVLWCNTLHLLRRWCASRSRWTPFRRARFASEHDYQQVQIFFESHFMSPSLMWFSRFFVGAVFKNKFRPLLFRCELFGIITTLFWRRF